MRFEWDERKSRSNYYKHGLTFDVAERAFSDPLHRSAPDRPEHGELRWKTIGYAGPEVLLVVVHTLGERHGEEVCRIISARRPTRSERARFEEDDWT